MNSALFDVPLKTLGQLLRSKEDGIRKSCLDYLLFFTSDPSRCKNLSNEYPEIINDVIKVTDLDNELSRLALNSLVNISSVEEGAKAIFSAELENNWDSKSVRTILNIVLNRNYSLAEEAANILTNLTTWEDLAIQVAKVFISEDCPFKLAFEAIHNKLYNPSCSRLSGRLCQLFGNLAQSIDFQKYLLTADEGLLFCSILPLINIGETILQKKGVVSTVYNCLFSSSNHVALLEHPFNILSYLLYPLAGPEEFDDEIVEKMPVELQYLPSDKKRESDPDVRQLLLKSLLLLCDTKNGRSILRSQEAYPILREYHKWEKNPQLLLACENIVDILIRTEDEIGMDNLSSLDVPEDLKEKFDKMDADYVQETGEESSNSHSRIH